MPLPLYLHSFAMLSGMMVFVFAFLFFLPQLRAQPETQHLVNVPWKVNPKLELTLHTRYRTRPTIQGLYQGRVGAWAGYRIAPKLVLVGGYYYTKLEDDFKPPGRAKLDWEALNRGFGGVEHQIANWNGIWSGRHFAEWFDVPDGKSDYYRVRHRIGWETRRTVAPYANYEYLWDKNGWRSSRYQAGLRFRLHPRAVWDFHYFREPRRQDTGWWPRNMWGTTLEVRVGKLNPGSRERPAEPSATR